MRYQVTDPVRVLDGVGPKVAENLLRMDIHSIGDLLRWYPRRYLDGSNPMPVASCPYGVESAFRLTIDSVTEGYTKKRGIRSLKALCSDDSGSITVQWFNQTYLKQKLQPGTVWVMIGVISGFRGERVLNAPRLEQRAVIIPIYPQSASVNSRLLHSLIGKALPETLFDDQFPEQILLEEGLLETKKALQMLHFPTHMGEVAQAQKTLAYEEVWYFFASLELNRSQVLQTGGIVVEKDMAFLEKVMKTLPFTLTIGQKKAINECLADIESGGVMTRLLNGDVGSGKTVVAGTIATLLAKNGYKTAFLAPTEILAEQHFLTLSKLFKSAGLKIGLWTAHHQDKETEKADLIVGTHALLYEKISLKPLGLVVIDEQHRFGVEQRAKLRDQQEVAPHVLSMTATPIPRTLALTLFADLAVSQLTERPSGRLPIKTFIIDNQPYKERMYGRITEEIDAGRQVFVVCPAIQVAEAEEGEPEVELQLFSQGADEKQGQRAVEAEYERLKKIFPACRVGLVHGKLKAQEKTKVMDEMAAGSIDILVATSVVEVGVDIPNASVLVVEGAESFGLAQLHQLRGRVGRASYQSYCFLCPHKMSQKIRERLKVLEESGDGFVIAEADLAQRGPGDVRGLSQSGLPDFHMATLTDVLFLQHVREKLKAYLYHYPEYRINLTKSIAMTNIQSLD